MAKGYPAAGDAASDTGAGLSGVGGLGGVGGGSAVGGGLVRGEGGAARGGVLERVGWLRRWGQVEEGRGNVLVWGAPGVDGAERERMGLWEGKGGKGPKLV